MNNSNESIKKIFTFGDTEKNRNRSVLNIAYGVDQDFLFGAAISMQSISMHNRDIDLIFHVFTDSVNDDYRLRIESFCRENIHVKVKIYIISEEFVNIFPTSKQWSYATFFRLIAFDYLGFECDKLLYIDADIMCKGSLSDILKVELSEQYYAAVVKDNEYMQEGPANRLNVPGLPGNYFNAGFIYLSLSQWKKNNFMHKVIEMLKSDKDLKKYKCLDQDVLNILFFGHCIFLNSKYDTLYGIDYELDAPSGGVISDNIIQEDTCLIHYVGITKPWHSWTFYPGEFYFYQAYENSFWSDVPLIRAKNEAQFKAKSLHQKKNKKYISSIVNYLLYRIYKYSRKIRVFFKI